MSLEIIPITFADANAFVKRLHRHHKPMPGCKFVLACANGELRGVAMCGRPVSRVLDDGFTIEVNRVCTDGTKNACSILYAAAWRAAKALGYRKCITYTLASETGASLRGAGWRIIGEVKGRSWSCPSRLREDHLIADKLKWSPA